jgi:hypothetical protein
MPKGSSSQLLLAIWVRIMLRMDGAVDSGSSHSLGRYSRDASSFVSCTQQSCVCHYSRCDLDL